VHADAAVEAHEIRHGRGIIDFIGLRLVHADIDVVVGGHAGGPVLEDAVERGFVVLALLTDLVAARRRRVILGAAGDLRDADEHAALVKRRLLIPAVDADQRAAGNAIAIPVGNIVRDRGRRMVGTIGNRLVNGRADTRHVSGFLGTGG
jgi:hypothetical protein